MSKNFLVLSGVVIVTILTIAFLIAAWHTIIIAANILVIVFTCGLSIGMVLVLFMLGIKAFQMLQEVNYICPSMHGTVQAVRHRGTYQELGVVIPQTLVTQAPLQALPAPTTLLPQAPTFRSIASQIQPGRLILGFNSQGAIYGDVSDLLSMGVVGKPGTGKSSALLYYLAMLLLVDASVWVFDPHGSLNELAGCINYTDDLNEIADIVPELHKELDERSALYKRTKRVKKPLLVLIDELPVISRWEQKNKPTHSTLELVERFVLEARKWNCFVILSGQSLPAEVLPTLTRDNLSSRIVFNSSNAHARMAGLDEESRKKLLPMLKRAQPGTAILDVSRRSEPDIVSLPYTTIDDLRDAVGMCEEPFNELHSGFQELSELSRHTSSESFNGVITGKLVNPMKAGVKSDESIPEFSGEEEEQIIRIAQAQQATYGKVIRSRIPMAMNPPRNNAVYPVVKYVLDRKGL